MIADASPFRISQFDGLRALAFMAVFLHHAFGAPLFWMGVDLFFVLSGFLITRNLLKLRETATVGSALATFFFRRVLRIIPPYYAALVLIYVCMPELSRGDLPWYLAFASNIHDALYGMPNGPLNAMWSIAIEEQFYLVWPWLVLFAPRTVQAPMFVGVIVLAAIARYAIYENPQLVYRLTICRMDLLAVGALLAWFESRDLSWCENHRRAALTLMSAAAVAFFALSFAFVAFRKHSATPFFAVVGYGLSTVFFASMLAYVRGLRTGVILRILCNPVLQYTGKISYMAYLTHRLALEMVLRHVTVARAPMAVLAFALTIGISTVSWYLLEQPLQRLRTWVSPKSELAFRVMEH